MNLFLHELRSNSKSFLYWNLSIIGLIVVFLSMYPIIANDAEYFLELMKNYNENLLKAIGINFEVFTSALGYYAFILNYVMLVAAIFAMNLGLGIMSKEVAEKTADFLMTKPVSRHQILTGKLMAALSITTSTFIIILVGSWLMLSLVTNEPFQFKIFMLLIVAVYLIQLIFLSLGIFLSILLRKVKNVISISLGIVFGFYMISALASTTGDEPLRFVTPFKYVDLMKVLKTADYDLIFILVGVMLMAALIVSSYIIYKKKDIHSV